jgi:hypothetical protein
LVASSSRFDSKNGAAVRIEWFDFVCAAELQASKAMDPELKVRKAE